MSPALSSVKGCGVFCKLYTCLPCEMSLGYLIRGETIPPGPFRLSHRGEIYPFRCTTLLRETCPVRFIPLDAAAIFSLKFQISNLLLTCRLLTCSPLRRLSHQGISSGMFHYLHLLPMKCDSSPCEIIIPRNISGFLF